MQERDRQLSTPQTLPKTYQSFSKSLLAKSVALLLLTASPALWAKPTPPLAISQEAAENQVRHFLEAPPAATLNDRLVAASELFAGRVYVLDPLGEGAGTFDPDPIYRFDAFDCQTFVETVLALQKAKDFSDFLLRFVSMRYDGGQTLYERRSHLIEAQWMPRNIASGVFTDITSEIGAGDEKSALFEVSEKGLAKGYQPFFERLRDLWPVGRYSISYLPLDWALANLEKIPINTIIQVVRLPKAGVPHTVTHQGIYLEKDGKRFLRNASSSPRFQKVVDRSLKGYLEFNQKYFSKAGRWPVIGINILQINDL
jgi:hypothetical protein